MAVVIQGIDCSSWYGSVPRGEGEVSQILKHCFMRHNVHRRLGFLSTDRVRLHPVLRTYS